MGNQEDGSQGFLGDEILNFIPLFPTVIYTTNIRIDTDHIYSLLVGMEHDPHLHIANGTSSYEKDPHLLHNEVFTDLRSRIQLHVDEYAMELGLMPPEISNSWFNIMGKGSHFKPHTHQMSVVSGSFYVRSGGGSSPLTFVSPLQQLKMYEVAVQENQFNENEKSIYNVSGDLILFPSWLLHYSMDNQFDERCVIAFNTNYET